MAEVGGHGSSSNNGSRPTSSITSAIPAPVQTAVGRRRSSTTSSSSSASTMHTTITIVKSSRKEIPQMSVPIPSPTIYLGRLDTAVARTEFAPSPLRTSTPQQLSPTGTPTPGTPDIYAVARPRQHDRQRSSSSSAAYPSPGPSAATVLISPVRPSRSSQGRLPSSALRAFGELPASTAKLVSVAITRQTPSSAILDKGKGPAVSSLPGSRVAHTSDNPLRRAPTLSVQAVALDTRSSSSFQLDPLFVTETTDSGDSPITPTSQKLGLRPGLPYCTPNFSKSEPVLQLGLKVPLPEAQLLDRARRLPLTPLEEINSPQMTLDSPADLAEVQDPFSSRALQEALLEAQKRQQTGRDETFYHALLEIVKTEEGYARDLTDLVEVHFTVLSFARFVTDEQRSIIVRDAVKLLDIHQRLSGKIQKVDEDLGWIREEAAGTPDEDTPVGSPGPSKRFKSSDATVEDAARRISAIFINEVQNLKDAYEPFCSGHAEALNITKHLTQQKAEWDAFEAHCTAQLAIRKSPSTRLHLADFLIKPIQRVCRYPLLFSNLLKNARKQGEIYSLDRLEEVVAALKVVTAGVDAAQRRRSLEIATVKLALRMDVQTAPQAFLLNHLEQVILVGSAHVIYTNTSPAAMSVTSNSSVKANFFGLVLYDTHLVFLKAKKTNLYDPKHWLPLRLFDIHKVSDGDGVLPYAIRLSYRDHSFEIGSLCHQEQDIWTENIERASSACRKKWNHIDTHTISTPPAFDETLICSEFVDSASTARHAASPLMPDSVLSAGELGRVSPEPSIAAHPATLSALSSDTESGAVPRPRLSLKPPAQRVATDLRLADLLSECILTSRAQSKRSHAMPLHGPPPRHMTAPAGQVSARRPHSFHPGSFSYKSIMDSARPSRRSSITDSDIGRPSLAAVSTESSSSVVTSSTATACDTAAESKSSRLQRSRTSTSGSETLSNKLVRSGTFSRIRRRATSSYPEQATSKAVQDLRQQHLNEQAIVSGSAANAGNASVARNSSTSSSSSCGSASTNPSQISSSSIETPQSSLPASPLLTPVDLEGNTRWSKFGDAISQTLSRKRSFASARPLLAVPPEPLLHGIQLERAQEAAEYIYTGNASGGSSISSHSGYVEELKRPGSSGQGHERRYCWDKFGWSRNGSFSSYNAQDSLHRTQSSLPGANRSNPNLHLSAEKRQHSSGSLWSVFNREGMSHTSSPTPSIYESAHEEDDAPLRLSPQASPQEITPTSSPPLTSGGNVPASLGVASPFVPSPQLSQQTSLSPPSLALNSPLARAPASKLKRSGSITARLRAFRTLGSTMTPLSSSAISSTSR